MAKPFRDSIVLLGDSLTCGQEVPGNLVARLNAAYTRTLDINNRAVHGYNTSCASRDREDDDHSSDVRLVVIWFGTNDALDLTTGGVPTDEFEQNLEEMVALLTSQSSPLAIAHATRPLSIILITPPSIEESMLEDPPKLSNAQMKLYRDAVLRVGARYHIASDGERCEVASIDLFDLLRQAGEKDDGRTLYTDGIHLSTKGFDVLWGAFDQLVHNELKGRGVEWDNPQDLPWTLPAAWDLFARQGREVARGSTVIVIPPASVGHDT